ncbi:MAG: hypothetical protein JXR78_03420 [Victivallales bacterium]|nr:hypothetical protein [Victivallales bacterium]
MLYFTKKCHLILIALLISSSCWWNLHAEDFRNRKVTMLLNNLDGTFENPPGNDGWRVLWGTFKKDNKVFHSGKQSLYVDGGELISTDKIKVEPGYEYYISAWSRKRNYYFRSKDLYGAGIGLQQLRADGAVNGNWYDMYAIMGEGMCFKEGDEDWVYTEARWTPKDTTVWLRPAIKSQALAGSRLWIDDFRVWKRKLPEKNSTMLVNAIENGSFEVKYNSDKTPFSYELFSPDNRHNNFGEVAVATTEEKQDRNSSLKIVAPCKVHSGIGVLSGTSAILRISIKSSGVRGKGGFARINLLDSNYKTIKTIDVAEVSGEQDWKTYEKTIDFSKDGAPQYVQWVLGMTNGSSGNIYFDNLQVLVEATLKPMASRPKNTNEVNVTVNADDQSGRIYSSPLDAYDRHCSDRIYSYSIGTAGPHLEGAERWLMMRQSLGIKYVRVHNGFVGNTICDHLLVDGKTRFGWDNGETGVTFMNTRLNPDDGNKPFPPVCRLDKEGRLLTDFSSIKYYLDHEIIKGGTKPIFGLEPVPNCLAIENDSHNKPWNYELWEEFNYRFIQFLIDNYGEDEIRTWIFETGNEPSTEPTFHGRTGKPNVLGDFLEMQDHTIAGCRRALPDIFIAGPSGPPESFIMPMLKHCAEGTNFATGKTGTKLDAISYHGYLGGSVNDLSWRAAEEQIFRYLRYREYFEKKTGKKLALYNTEFAAIYREVTPKSPPNSTYDNHIQAIGTLHMVNFSGRLGVELMAFFYASPIYFAPVRHATGLKKSPMQSNTPEFLGEPTMVTFHGIFKPVTRIFQMLSWLNGGKSLKAEADCEPIYTMAVKDKKTIKVLCYSFDVDPLKKYSTKVNIQINGVSKGARYTVTCYELSATQSNSWYLATKEKLTQEICENNIEVVDRINRASRLIPQKLKTVTANKSGNIKFGIKIPAFSVKLLVLTPENE